MILILFVNFHMHGSTPFLSTVHTFCTVRSQQIYPHFPQSMCHHVDFLLKLNTYVRVVSDFSCMSYADFADFPCPYPNFVGLRSRSHVSDTFRPPAQMKWKFSSCVYISRQIIFLIFFYKFYKRQVSTNILCIQYSILIQLEYKYYNVLLY